MCQKDVQNPSVSRSRGAGGGPGTGIIAKRTNFSWLVPQCMLSHLLWLRVSTQAPILPRCFFVKDTVGLVERVFRTKESRAPRAAETWHLRKSGEVAGQVARWMGPQTSVKTKNHNGGPTGDSVQPPLLPWRRALFL